MSEGNSCQGGRHVNSKTNSPSPPPQRTVRLRAQTRIREDSAEKMMMLGAVSYLDCLVFCVLLAPQLLWHVGLFDTASCVLQALPFFVLRLPLAFVRGRYLRRREERSLFVQKATPFEDFVIRCVRYAFAHIPPRIGRVFFSKPVALPFLRFRMLRHGYLTSHFQWKEYETESFRGLWICRDATQKPDLLLYYIHGGGFAMGSSYFYLEFLLTWCSTLESAGYKNPAVFALEYTLVPDASYPTQIQEAIAAYEHILSLVDDPSVVCVSGDSAGAMIILSLLLHLSDERADERDHGRPGVRMPGLAVLISPWVSLVSDQHKNTESDYLDVYQLRQYGRQLANGNISESDPLVSPGCCRDIAWWKRASPSGGIFVAYGQDEVLASDIEGLIRILGEAGVSVGSKGEPGGIHAWPVASLFLCSSENERLKGLRTMTDEIRCHIIPDR